MPSKVERLTAACVLLAINGDTEGMRRLLLDEDKETLVEMMAAGSDLEGAAEAAMIMAAKIGGLSLDEAKALAQRMALGESDV